jgi:predicted DNA-binding transcriptional regulator AlpA
MPEKFLTSREARGLYGVSRATWDRARKRPGFPKPVMLGPRCYRWRETQLLAYAEKTQDGKAA